MDPQYAVIVSNVFKRYSSSAPILNGLNMKIPTGKMYGLLGPSGCGKTTLLKCILGNLDIDHGTIKLSVNNWKQVGFMPQIISLHTEFKINELFIFYGTIFGLFGDQLRSRVNELTDLLELPPLSKLIGDCSGGQQRRISLAVTLLHNPDLLLLDEPTVGLDPLLSQKICIYLKNLSLTQMKTIVITTHYMEEARTLNMIGLMRGGVLLAETSPQALIDRFNCETLDDVFLQLSIRQQNNTPDDIVTEYPTKLTKSTSPLRNKKFFTTNHVKAQIYKNYKWTLRNIPVTLFIWFLPFFSACLTGTLFQDIKTELKIGYYSEELYNASCEVNRTVRARGCEPSPPFSCQYIEILQERHVTERFNSVEEGLEAIKVGESYALISFPYNFTNTVINRLNFKTPKKNETIHEDIVEVWMDTTVYTVAFHAKVDIYVALQKLMERKCKECGVPIELSRVPMNFKEAIYGKNTKLCSKIYPHFLNAILFYTTYIYTSASFQMEKTSGVLERIQMNGLTTSELLTANFIVQFIVLNIQNISSLSAVHLVFGENYLGSLALMYFILFLSESLGTALGLLVITYSSSAAFLNYVGVGIVLTIMLSNGLVWPSEAVHWTLKPIVNLIPVNAASASYSQVMLHGFPLFHHNVFPGVLNVTVSIVIIAAIIAYRVKRNNNQL